MGGMVLETNMSEILSRIEDQNKLEKSEAGLIASALKNVNLPNLPNLPQQIKDIKLPDLPQAIKDLKFWFIPDPGLCEISIFFHCVLKCYYFCIFVKRYSFNECQYRFISFQLFSFDQFLFH